MQSVLVRIVISAAAALAIMPGVVCAQALSNAAVGSANEVMGRRRVPYDRAIRRLPGGTREFVSSNAIANMRDCLLALQHQGRVAGGKPENADKIAEERFFYS